MARQVVRDLKQAVRAGALPGAGVMALGLARDGALALLKRSISFGHGRLAVIRLLTAVRCGAEVPPKDWEYCRDMASSSRDATLQALFREAEDRAPTLKKQLDG